MNLADVFDCELLHASVVIETAKREPARFGILPDAMGLIKKADDSRTEVMTGIAHLRKNEAFDEDAFFLAHNAMRDNVKKLVAMMPSD